jgi:uncharacterized protein
MAGAMSNLDDLLKQASAAQQAPVERWNPPYCGDIGLSIARDGTWFYQGSPIGRQPMVKLFARVLRRDEDGRHYLVTPVEKVDVAVADAPFLAVEMEATGEGSKQSLTFRTNVDDVVRCGPRHPLRFELQADGGIKPYLLVRGRLEALLTRSRYLDLVDLAQHQREGDVERFGVWSDGVFFALPA